MIAHDGGTIGQSRPAAGVPERDVAVCVLTNSTNGDALGDRIVSEVFEAEAGIDVPPAPSPGRGRAADGPGAATWVATSAAASPSTSWATTRRCRSR